MSFGWERLLLKVDLSAVNIVFRDLTIHDYAISSISLFSSSQSPLIIIIIIIIIISQPCRCFHVAGGDCDLRVEGLRRAAPPRLQEAAHRRASRVLSPPLHRKSKRGSLWVEAPGWFVSSSSGASQLEPPCSQGKIVVLSSHLNSILSTLASQLTHSLPHSLTHSLPHLLTLKKHTQDRDKAVRRGPRRAGGHLAVLPGGAVTAAHLRSLAAHVRPGPLRGFHVAQESGPWRARLSRGVGVGGVAGCGAALALGSRGSGDGERESARRGAGQGETWARSEI